MEEAKFTIDTAKTANDGFIADAQRQMKGLSKDTTGLGGPQAAAPQGGLGAVPKRTTTPDNQEAYDQSAIDALGQGMVQREQVMGDPNVSDRAKQAISQGL